MIVNISKVKVSETMKGQWAVTLNIKLMEGVEELFSQDFSEDYNTGGNVEETVGKLKEKMQEAINKYKFEQAILNHNKMDSAIIALQNSLEV